MGSCRGGYIQTSMPWMCNHSKMAENCGYLSNTNAFTIYAISVVASHTSIGIANYGLKAKVLCSRSPNSTVHGYMHHLLHHLGGMW